MKPPMLVLSFALVVCALFGARIPALATFDSPPPPPPQALYGDATIRSQPAPIGTVVEARGENVKIGTSTNPIATTVAGRYGGPTMGERKLGIQGWLTNGQPIYFYLNGERAQASYNGATWLESIPFVSGVVTRVHLRVLWRYYVPYVVCLQ